MFAVHIVPRGYHGGALVQSQGWGGWGWGGGGGVERFGFRLGGRALWITARKHPISLPLQNGKTASDCLVDF